MLHVMGVVCPGDVKLVVIFSKLYRFKIITLIWLRHVQILFLARLIAHVYDIFLVLR